MLRIGQVEPTATSSGQYTDGNVAGGIAATRLRAAAFNAIQEELANIVESAGITLSPDDSTQVLMALRKIFLSRKNPFGDINSDGDDAIAIAIANLKLNKTVDLASNALSKKFVKILSSGDFSSCSISGIYQVSITDPASISDFPNFAGAPLYNYGVMYVASDGGVISQTYISHIGQVAVRTKWSDQPQFKPWAVQYSAVCEPVTFKYGSPLIGSLIPWSRSQMPHEIWPDCGMEFIPWMAQSFDPLKYPLLHDLFPSNTLPVDMRGYTDRGWDNSRGIDPGRGLLSVQEDALQNVTGTFKCNSWRDGPVSATGALYNGGSESGGSPNNAANNAQVLGFDMSRAPGVRTSTETRMKNVAWNMIVRAK
ncbi:hypothetical protein [Edwardsiella piscicida]|uniref:hypothetical protein n=1 Tax=Edwardsiella piscicida TaxID=1263550 RepID=UPI000B1C1B44|nr:hypothetical protein [Edwardsiella piscicida]